MLLVVVPIGPVITVLELLGVIDRPGASEPAYDRRMADSYPCPHCDESVRADAGERLFSPQIDPGEDPGDKMVQRVDCPGCGEPLIRAANEPGSPWRAPPA